MALLERVATLLRANLNDLVDRAEEPDKIVKQVILDMENQYLQVKTQVAVSIADQHILEKKLREQEDTAKDWMRKAEIAEISCALQFASLLARQATAEPKKARSSAGRARALRASRPR